MELKRIFKFRNLWIGIAMLWIGFFHAGFWIYSENLLLFKNFGYGGVDFCLFASGVGCYFSLEKDPDILRFLNRRLKRLGPTYLCFILPWLLWKTSVSQLPIRAVLGNLLGIQTLVSWEYHFNWYIGGLVVYYFSMPYMKQLTDSQEKLWQDVVAWFCLAVATVPFWDSGNTIVLLSRLPVLYSGMAFGKLAKQGYVLRAKDYLAQGIAVVTGAVALVAFQKNYPDLLWSRGLYWYPFALIVPGSCIFFSAVAEKVEVCRFFRWINKSLEIIGIYSFELYLVHVFLYEGLMPGIMERFWMIPVNLLWAMTIPVVIAGTFLLNRITSFLNRIMTKQKA